MALAPGSGPPPTYDVDPELVASAVTSCPAVAGMSGGPVGTFATYLPGRAVVGVRWDPDRVEVHVVLRHGATVSEAAGQIREALGGRVADRAVDIAFEDVADPQDVQAPPPAGGGPGAAPADAPAAATVRQHSVPAADAVRSPPPLATGPSTPPASRSTQRPTRPGS